MTMCIMRPGWRRDCSYSRFRYFSQNHTVSGGFYDDALLDCFAADWIVADLRCFYPGPSLCSPKGIRDFGFIDFGVFSGTGLFYLLSAGGGHIGGAFCAVGEVHREALYVLLSSDWLYTELRIRQSGGAGVQSPVESVCEGVECGCGVDCTVFHRYRNRQFSRPLSGEAAVFAVSRGYFGGDGEEAVGFPGFDPFALRLYDPHHGFFF